MADLMRTLLGYGFRVDPDHRQDRGSSPCTSREMTPEEIQKYGPPKKEYRHSISAVMTMTRKDPRGQKNSKITQEQLIEACKKYSAYPKDYENVSKEIGIAPSTVRSYISKWSIRKLIFDSSQSE